MSRLLNKVIARTLYRFKRYWSNDRLRVYIAHDAFAVCHLRGRFRPEVVAQSTIQFALDTAGSAPDLSDSLTMLSAWLKEHSYQASIEWIIGIDHVRYLSLPWDEQLSSDTFCHTLARALFVQQAFGSDSRFSSCQVRFGPLRYGHTRLAAFVPDCVIRSLTSWSDRHHCRTTRITPSLSLVWDSFAHRFKKSNGKLSIVEGARLQNIVYDRGMIVAVTVHPFNKVTVPSSPDLTDFVFPAIYASATSDSGLKIRGASFDVDHYMAYALCGVL